MEVPSYKEDHISQIPALQMLQKIGYQYLTPAEALRYRGGKTTQVILEDILRQQLHEINSIKVSSQKTSIFSNENIEKGILSLKELPMNEGYITACEWAYNLLTLGKSLEQSIDGDKKSFTLKYIDWENIDNNVFHVTEEFSVMRSTSKEHYRPDIVLFVNGIPLGIIECKRPDMKEPLKQAISQHIRNQQEDGIRLLYAYSQVCLSLADQKALYGTNATPENFWSKWEEKFDTTEEEKKFSNRLIQLKNKKLSVEQSNRLFEDRFRYVRKYFERRESEEVLPTTQDKYILGLCTPQRILDLFHNFILYDNGLKKIARYQQYYAIKKSMRRKII